MRIALVQKCSYGRQVDKNIEAAEKIIKTASDRKADIVLFPECFINGYILPVTNDEALSMTDRAVAAFCGLAAKYHIGVVATALTKGDKKARNSAMMIDRDGRILMKYDKVHTCDFSLEACLESGSEFKVCTFDGVRIGLMICYDREYPESARVLMLKGAELILVPNDCCSMQPRVRALSVRAYENMTGVAMANPPGTGAGMSCAFSPVCWDKEGQSLDNTIILAGEEEGIFMADFDMDAIRSYRKTEMMGNTFRKPDTYDILLDRTVRPPFIREVGKQ